MTIALEYATHRGCAFAPATVRAAELAHDNDMDLVPPWPGVHSPDKQRNCRHCRTPLVDTTEGWISK